MRNLIIYSEGNNSLIEDLCRKVTELDVLVKNADEIKDMASEDIAVAILAFLDSIFGGIASNMQDKFDFTIFITGFFFNALIAMFLVYLGQKLNVDIYLVAVIVFSSRIFTNFSIIRRIFIERVRTKNKTKKISEK